MVESAKHPVSYMEVLEMLDKGEKPPGIRDDINDKPPDPNVSPPISKLKPVPKPWNIEEITTEQSGSSISNHPEDGHETPSRRDLSGSRPVSIFQSIESAPQKSPSIVVEKTFSGRSSGGDDSSVSKSLEYQLIDGSLGRPMTRAWKPPPLPSPTEFSVEK
jgi:hypothetical protein